MIQLHKNEGGEISKWKWRNVNQNRVYKTNSYYYELLKTKQSKCKPKKKNKYRSTEAKKQTNTIFEITFLPI